MIINNVQNFIGRAENSLIIDAAVPLPVNENIPFFPDGEIIRTRVPSITPTAPGGASYVRKGSLVRLRCVDVQRT